MNFLTTTSPGAVAQTDAEAYAIENSQRLKNQASNALVAQYGPQAADPTLWQGAVDANKAQQIAPLQVEGAQDQARVNHQTYDKSQASAVIGTLNHLIQDEGMEPGAALDTVASHAHALGVDPDQLESLKPLLLKDPKGTIDALNDQLNPDKTQVFGQPIYTKDASGKVTIGYATKTGEFKNIDVGNGQTVVAPGTGSVQVIKNADGTYSLAQATKAGGVNTDALPAGATPETALGTEGRLAQGVVRLQQGQERVNLDAARVRLMAQREVRMAASGLGSLSPQGMDYAAQQYREKGTVPGLGNGGAAVKVAIINRAAQMAAAEGKTGEADALGQQAFKERGTAVNDLGKSTPSSAGGRVSSANALVTHLDQLNGLSASLTSGNLPAINAARQAYMQQTGNPAPANFNAVKNIAADEAVKFIVANGGTLHDRQQAQQMFAGAQSPQQLAGAITQVQHLAAGQLSGIRQRYQAIGATNEFDATLTPRARQLLGVGQQTAPGGATTSPTAGLRAKYGMQ